MATRTLPEEHAPMPVVRVHTRNGSHIDPPLNQAWSELDRLRWHAGVVQADCGVTAYITPGALSTPGPFGRMRRHMDEYAIRIGARSSSSFNYHEAWDYLNGVEAGANAIRDDRADRAASEYVARPFVAPEGSDVRRE